MPTEENRAIELLGRLSYGRVATSMRAMPFVAPARHIVSDGRVLIRMHHGLGYHRACDGSVVAYGADTLDSGSDAVWSVQFTGTAVVVRPTEAELAAFGPEPVRVDGEPFTPVYLRIEPQFVTVHSLDYASRRPDSANPTGEASAPGPPAAPATPSPRPSAARAPGPSRHLSEERPPHHAV